MPFIPSIKTTKSNAIFCFLTPIKTLEGVDDKLLKTVLSIIKFVIHNNRFVIHHE